MNRRGFFSLLSGVAVAPACQAKEAATPPLRLEYNVDARATVDVSVLSEMLRLESQRIVDRIRRGRLSQP